MHAYLYFVGQAWWLILVGLGLSDRTFFILAYNFLKFIFYYF